MPSPQWTFTHVALPVSVSFAHPKQQQCLMHIHARHGITSWHHKLCGQHRMSCWLSLQCIVIMEA